MLKPPMPNIPGVGAVTDTLDFVKNLWGSMGVPGMNIPGMAVPTLSVDELDKKIADLKAVEAWLNINVSMLRGTIQTMEVQRGTIATLKSMGATLANAVKQPGADEKSVLAAAPFVSAFFSQPAAPAKAEAPPEPVKEEAKEQKEATANAAMSNPVAWWNMLQEQFNQAVVTAMSTDTSPKGAEKAKDTVNGTATDSAAATAAPKSEAKAAPAKRAPAKPKSAT